MWKLKIKYLKKNLKKVVAGHIESEQCTVHTLLQLRLTLSQLLHAAERYRLQYSYPVLVNFVLVFISHLFAAIF